MLFGEALRVASSHGGHITPNKFSMFSKACSSQGHPTYKFVNVLPREFGGKPR